MHIFLNEFVIFLLFFLFISEKYCTFAVEIKYHIIYIMFLKIYFMIDNVYL